MFGHDDVSIKRTVCDPFVQVIYDQTRTIETAERDIQNLESQVRVQWPSASCTGPVYKLDVVSLLETLDAANQ